MDDAYCVGAVGVSVAAPSGSSSASTAIPLTASGLQPKYVRVLSVGGTSTFRHDWGKTGTAPAATNADFPVTATDAAIVTVNGATRFTVFGVGSANTVIVTPLENDR